MRAIVDEWLDGGKEALAGIEQNGEKYKDDVRWIAIREGCISVGKSLDSKEAETTTRAKSKAFIEDQEKKVLMEIVETETRYVKSLDILVNNYRHPLFEAEYAGEKIVELEKVYRIFSNLEDLLVVNTELLDQLRTRIIDEDSRRVGDIFLNMSFALKIYSRYISDYDAARSTLAECMETNTKFISFVEKTQEETAEDSRGQKLESLMIMPVQRIPRYELLLRELLKLNRKVCLNNTTNTDELEQCMDSIREVAEANNERIRATETKAALYDLQKRFLPKLQPPIVGSGAAQRHLIREGVMRKVHGRGGNQVECRMILLSDCLLYAIEKTLTQGGSNKLELHRRIMLADPTTSFSVYETGKDEKTMIAMINSEKSMVCVCDSEKERDAWLSALQAATSRAQYGVIESSSMALSTMTLTETITTTNSPNKAKVAMSIWEQDTPQCTVTRIKFTVMNRRHHCRVNGECVSAQASKARFNLKELGNRFESCERVCDLCSRDLTLLNYDWAQVISRRDELRSQIANLTTNNTKPEDLKNCCSTLLDPLFEKADKNHGIIFGSWLHKKGGTGSIKTKSRKGALGRRNWKKRWCELRRFDTSYEFLYFDEPGTDFELFRGRVSLRQATVCISDSTNYLMFVINTAEGRDYPIRILDDTQPLPPSDQEKGTFALWNYALTHAIEKASASSRRGSTHPAALVMPPTSPQNRAPMIPQPPPIEDNDSSSTDKSLAAWRIDHIRKSHDWYWQNAAGDQCGPSSFDQLRAAYASNELLDTCHVYSETITETWKLLDDATHLKLALTAP